VAVHKEAVENGRLQANLAAENSDLRRQLAEARLRIQELSTALDNAHDGFCISDGRAVMLETNASFNRITGLRPEDIIGRDGAYLEEHNIVRPSIVLQVLKQRRAVTTFQNYMTGKVCMNTANPIFSPEGEIVRVITNVRDMTELNRLEEQLSAAEKLADGLADELEQIRFEQYKQNEIVAKSQEMNRVLELAFRVGHADSTVIITGESGVGKEIIAHTVWRSSPQRRKGPLIKINCGALPENLLESELFGYDKGAFTGAKSEGKPGKFELANHGTIFLDEIGEMPLSLQVKLLRVIQEKEVSRLGGVKPIPLDIRIITATNQDLHQLMASGKFRSDLFYRLNVVPIHVPPLRERQADIKPLIVFFLQKYNSKYGRGCQFSPQAMEVLQRYPWPGNIRELENLVENLVVMAEQAQIECSDLPANFQENCLFNYSIHEATLAEILDKVERDILVQSFQTHRYAKDVAAALGISPATVCRKAQRLGIRMEQEELHK